jgi:hypothetical protein
MAIDLARALRRKMPDDPSAVAVANQLEADASVFATWEDVTHRPPTAERNEAIGRFLPRYRVALEILTKGPLG